MLSGVVYDQDEYDDDDDTPDDQRARMITIFAFGIIAALLGGLALGFLLDWIQGRL
jgi:hypothetical protein